MPNSRHANIEVRRPSVSDLTEHDIAQWRRLSQRSADPNAFWDPAFVLPLARYQASAYALRLAVVVDGGTSEWLAAGLFRSAWPSRSYPLPHLASEASIYTFLDQPLLDAERGPEALDAFLWDLSSRRDILGLRFGATARDSRVMRLLNAAAERCGLTRRVDRTWRRAQVHLNGITPESLLAGCTKSRRKSLRRARRWLEERGRIGFRLVFPKPGDLNAANRFLKLEGMGWKGANGTALGADPQRERFFREVTDSFARNGAICFGELLVDGEVIASSVNLAASDTLFAFKIGWKPSHGRGSPGLWSEIELASRLSAMGTGLKRIDSCSAPGSHVESIWPDRCAMESVSYTWSRRGRAVAGCWTRLKTLRRILGSHEPAGHAGAAAACGS
jgi:CelD/BcsL family acetyltransferase involved in cellulose biosynthesis